MVNIDLSSLHQQFLRTTISFRSRRLCSGKWSKTCFLMHNQPHTNTNNWQKHIFFFTIVTDTTVFEIGTITSNVAFALDDIQFELCESSNTDIHGTVGHVNVHTVFVHDWASIHPEWNFEDPETEILEYKWAIGTVQGGTQLQTFVNVGGQTIASNNGLRLEHDTKVHITVVAINAAGLQTVSYSDPVIIDLTPPLCNYLHDGSFSGQDLDFISGNIFEFHWDIVDVVSGLKACSWAIGTSEGDTSINNFTTVEPHQKTASRLFEDIPDEKIYVTVRCTNGADVTHTCYSYGVKLVQSSPSINDVILELLTTSQTQYVPRGGYHGNNTEIRFRWTGFDPDEGVQNFMISLDGNDVLMSEIIEESTFGYSYASFTGLNLKDGHYTVSITGINEVQMYSLKISQIPSIWYQNHQS